MSKRHLYAGQRFTRFVAPLKWQELALEADDGSRSFIVRKMTYSPTGAPVAWNGSMTRKAVSEELDRYEEPYNWRLDWHDPV